METDKIQQRVLEIEENIKTASPEQQAEMINELLSIASQIEKSLSEIEISFNDEIEEINEEDN